MSICPTGPLFDPPPDPPRKPLPPRGGITFDRVKDAKRLADQHERVLNLVIDGQWRTLAEIAKAVDAPEASVSARLRDFRKPQFGGHEVKRRRRGGNTGTFEYCLIAS